MKKLYPTKKLRSSIFILTIIFICFFVVKLVVRYSSEGIYPIRYSRALKLISSGKYERSVRQLRIFIRSEPDNIDAYRKLAISFSKLRDPEGGIKLFNSLEKANPEIIYNSLGRGYLYQQTGKEKKALTEFQRVILTIPKVAVVYRDYTDICMKLEKRHQADSFLNVLNCTHPDDPVVIYGLAYLNYKSGNTEKATHYLEKCIDSGESLPDYYVLKCQILWYSGKYSDFLETGRKGLEVARDKKDLQNQCIFLGNIGLACNYLGQYREAISFNKKAVKIARRIYDTQQEVRSTGNLGISYRDSRQYEKAFHTIEKAIRLAVKTGEKNYEALFYRNLGSVCQMMEDYDKAMYYLNKALTVSREIKDSYTECLTLLNLGLAYWNQGNYPQALDYYTRSMELAKNTGNLWAEGRCLSAMGTIYFEQGLYVKTLELNEKSLDIASRIGDIEGEMYCFGNLAVAYNEMGETGKTLDYYNKALAASEKIGNTSEKGRNLLNLGCTYHKLLNYGSAMEYYRKALKVNDETNNSKQRAEIYGNMGILLVDMHEFAGAEEFLERALQIGQELKSPYINVSQLLNLGFLKYSTFEPEKALYYFNEALKLANSIDLSHYYWQAQAGMAMSLKEMGKKGQAFEYYQKASQNLENTWEMIPEERLQSGFLSEHMNVYENILGLLFEMHQDDPDGGYDRLAFTYAEKAKARAFMQNLAESRYDILSGINSELGIKRQNILKQISENQRLLFREETANRNRKELLSELNAWEDELESLEREIRSSSIKYRSLIVPETVDIEKIQEDLPGNNEVILEYSVGTEKSYLWLIRKDTMCYYVLADRQTLSVAVQDYLQTIEHPVSISNPFMLHAGKGRAVFDLLLEPCKNDLSAGDHIIIIADDILHFFPFESAIGRIHEGSGKPAYFIEDYVVSYCPSALSLSFLYAQAQDLPDNRKSLLAFADPVTDFPSGNDVNRSIYYTVEDQDLNPGENSTGIFRQNLKEEFSLNPLPFAKQEVMDISALFPAGMADIFYGEDASESRIKSTRLDAYKYIHFATHGLIEESRPFRSGILLSTTEDSVEDGLLQISEILNLELNADMVVLSACQTARGKLYRGEGIVGISRSFLYSGSSSVIVSLWNINDRSTASLMKGFYSNLIRESYRARALQESKLAMIGEDNIYSHPYYWSPLILIGDPE